MNSHAATVCGVSSAGTGLVDAAGSADLTAEAQRLLETLARAQPRDTMPQVALARLLAATGDFEAAAGRAAEVMAAEPDNPRGPELLASIVADAGDLDRLRPLVFRMQQAHPDREDSWYYAAVASYLGGNLNQAVERAGHVRVGRAIWHVDASDGGERVMRLARLREGLQDTLGRMPGVKAYPSEANFILIELADADPKAVFESLYRRGVLVRDGQRYLSNDPSLQPEPAASFDSGLAAGGSTQAPPKAIE